MLTITHTTPLHDRMLGRVVYPSDPGWDAARMSFNTLVNARPAAIAYPRVERDVMAVVGYARENGLRIAPQATGHNLGAHADLQDTVLVDVRELREVAIDLAGRRVRVGAGVRWEDVVPQLSEHGLAALHGSSPDVGVAGYSLGGGMGWLARKHGLQANSVLAIELITADGRFVRADRNHHAELFWALRGGGGNFGVVTAIEFAVYPLEEAYAGALFFPYERAGEVLHRWARMLPGLPEAMMTWASLLRFPDAPDVPEPVRGGAFTVVMAAHAGEEATGRELLRPVRELGPVMDTFATLPPAALGDLAMDPRDPLPLRSAHHLIEEMSPAAVDALLAAAGPGSGTSLAMVQLRHTGGALARGAPGAGARATLPGQVALFALAVPAGPSAQALADEVEGLGEAMRPFSAGFYPNFVERPVDAAAFFDAQTWQRLRDVKAAYDPDDLFRGNHRIPPAC